MSVAFNVCLPNTARYNVIRIDDYRHSDIKGQFYNCAVQEYQSFNGIMDLIKQLDYFFDEILYPMDQVRKREFYADKSIFHPEKEIKFSSTNNRDIDNHQGQVATFVLKVQFRSSASWQGEVIWLEENKKEYFRSVLELILLIEEAMHHVEITKDG